MSKTVFSLLLLFAAILAPSTLPFKPTWTAQAAIIEGRDYSTCLFATAKIVQDHQSVQEGCRMRIRESAAEYEKDYRDNFVGNDLLSTMMVYLAVGDFEFFDKYTNLLEKMAAQFQDRYDFVLEIRMLLLQRKIFGGDQNEIRVELNSLVTAIDRFTTLGPPEEQGLFQGLLQANLNRSAAYVAHAQYYLGDFQGALNTFSLHPSIKEHAPQAEIIRVLSTHYPNNELLLRDMHNAVLNWHWGNLGKGEMRKHMEECCLAGWERKNFLGKGDEWTKARLQQLGYLENTGVTTGQEIVDAFVACASQGPGKCRFHSATPDGACGFVLDTYFFCIRK